jgi:glyoxylase-like metal-dependent hydrolase (beta-lactamase superfamily II)
MREVADGILQLTLPLPFVLDHVHCYLLRRPTGGWLLVDTGLGVHDWEERWGRVVEELDAPIEQIFVTHFHPDHVGGVADVQRVTGAEVLQGALDHRLLIEQWADRSWAVRAFGGFRAHGVPEDIASEIFASMDAIRPMVRYVDPVTPLEPGDDVDGWQVMHFGGHAEGHLALFRNGVLVGGDNLLLEITPNIGYYLDGDVDPLGTYLETLARIDLLAPRLTLPGHGPLIVDSGGRVRETVAHHDGRLAETVAALDRAEPRDAYQVSLTLWAYDLEPIHRRFAVQEAIAHLERLVRDGRVRRHDGDDGSIAYTAA